MSRQADEAKYQSRGKRGQAANPSRSSRFVAYHPTKAEKDQIRSLGDGYAYGGNRGISLLQEGHKLTIGYKPEQEAFYVMLREGGKAWDEAVTISFWHSDLETCFKQMAFALATVFEDFPDLAALPPEDNSW